MNRSAPQQEHVAAESAIDDGVYVYALTSSMLAVPEAVSGVADARVETVVHGDVAAVVSSVALDHPLARRAEVLSHSRVVDEVARHGTVLPLRFGTVMTDRRSVVVDLLAPRYQQIQERLGELTGLSQLVLRATYVEEVVLGEVVRDDERVAELHRRTRDLPEDAGYAERVRLGELVAQAMEAKRAQDGDQILSSVVPWTQAHAFRSGAGVDQLLDVALLVEESRRQELEQHLETLAEAVHERIRLSLVGPTAPYDFVEDAWV